MNAEYVQEWIEKAEQDYQAILILSRQRKKLLTNVICYHAQQCVEKYLKALFAVQDIEIPKTHNLVFLSERLTKSYPDLELMKDVLRNLTQYAVELRYPGETATRQEAKQAIEQVKELRRILLVKLK